MNGSDTRPRQGLHVLVAEDNEVNQKVTSAMLQHFGIQPDIAENGKVAIEMAATKKYDLILMDCQMPVMNGYETTSYIRGLSRQSSADFQTCHDVIIIAMTANASPDDMETCMLHGMNDFIAKPIELDIMSDMLQKWFG